MYLNFLYPKHKHISTLYVNNIYKEDNTNYDWSAKFLLTVFILNEDVSWFGDYSKNNKFDNFRYV
jgi:hypothetical protein